MEPTAPSIFDELEKDKPEYVLATTGQRLANYLIDGLAYYLLFMILEQAWRLLSLPPLVTDILGPFHGFWYDYFYWSVTRFVFYCLFEGVTRGRSPGKYVTGTIAIRPDGQVPTMRRILLRSLMREVPLEPLSMLVGPPLHDTLSGTIVIQVRGEG